MDNNDVLRRLRYAFDFKDHAMVDIFAQADHSVTGKQVSGWLKKDDDAQFIKMSDKELAIFLNGLINLKRGKREGEQPEPEERLSNNMIFQKLRIALNLKAEEIIDICKLAQFGLSKPELSSFFRKPGARNYRVCKDQILRYFLMGLQIHLRPSDPESKS